MLKKTREQDEADWATEHGFRQPGQKRNYVTNERFITLCFEYQGNAKRIAFACGMTPNCVRVRKCYLRRKGVNMPKQWPGRDKLDVVKLNKLIQELTRPK